MLTRMKPIQVLLHLTDGVPETVDRGLFVSSIIMFLHDMASMNAVHVFGHKADCGVATRIESDLIPSLAFAQCKENREAWNAVPKLVGKDFMENAYADIEFDRGSIVHCEAQFDRHTAIGLLHDLRNADDDYGRFLVEHFTRFSAYQLEKDAQVSIKNVKSLLEEGLSDGHVKAAASIIEWAKAVPTDAAPNLIELGKPGTNKGDFLNPAYEPVSNIGLAMFKRGDAINKKAAIMAAAEQVGFNGDDNALYGALIKRADWKSAKKNNL